jgi:hypothetical protein
MHTYSTLFVKRGSGLSDDLGEIAMVSFDLVTCLRIKEVESIWWAGDVRRSSFLAMGTIVTG